LEDAEMKILVTGGAGFIGSSLVERLVNDGHEVRVLDKLLRGNKIPSDIFKKIDFTNGDIINYDLVHEMSEGCDVIFHLAALLGVDIVADNPTETMDVESMGTRNVAKAAVRNNVKKILYASTSGIYGHSSMEKAVDEEIIVDPRTSYAMAKRFNEIYLSALSDEKGVDATCLRFFNVYGERQDNRMVIPRFFEQAVSGKPITVYGTGEQTRDFTYIDDVVEACIQIMEKVSGFEIFNVANENEGSIIGLAHLIRELCESSAEVRLLEAPSRRYDFEVERRVGSSDKLFRFTGFKPSLQLEEGLRAIYENRYKRQAGR